MEEVGGRVGKGWNHEIFVNNFCVLPMEKHVTVLQLENIIPDWVIGSAGERLECQGNGRKT